jgi:DNA-binding response OmpR family regulator
MLSASIFEEERIARISTGCDDFLRKPFRETEVFELLHKHLGVRFVYEEETEADQAQSEELQKEQILTPEALNALPHELLYALQEAV